MAKNQSVAKPKKTSLSTMVIYAIIILMILIATAVVGTKFDGCLRSDGTIDISLFSEASFSFSKMIDSLENNGYAAKLTFLMVVAIGIYILYKYTVFGNRFHRRGVEHGSARWGDEAEVKEVKSTEKPKFLPMKKDGRFLCETNENGEQVFSGYYQDNNIIFSKDVWLNLDTHTHRLNLNSLIIGGSGAGKTRFFALPNIMQLNTSYVVTDPKGEILAATGKMLEMAGYKVRVFNTINMEHSNNYNPFDYVYDHNGKFVEDNVLKLVNVLFSATKGDGEKEDFWSQKGKTLLEAIIFLLFEESVYNAKDKNKNIIESKRDRTHLNFFSVTEKMRKLRYPPKGSQVPDGFFLTQNPGENPIAFEERRNKAFLSELDKDFIELEKQNPDALALRLYKEVRNAPEETGQSFLSSANVKTFIYNLDNIKNLTCCDNIHLETIGDEKTALFLIISATDSTYNFMSAMLYTQMFDTLSNRANFKHKGTLPVHVRCIMDEFPQIGEIPNFEKVVAFVRSMGMSLNIIVQNLSQLKAKYEKTWEIIVGNCDTQLFLGGKEESTLKALSESLGKETIDIKSSNKTKGRQSSTSENNSIVGRELMQINELATLPIDECIIQMRSHNPFHSKKYPLEKHPNYKWLSFSNSEMLFDVEQIHAISVAELTKSQSKTSDNQENKKEVLTPTAVKSDDITDKLNDVISETEQLHNEYKSENEIKVKHFDENIAILDNPLTIIVPINDTSKEVKSNENEVDTSPSLHDEFDISDEIDVDEETSTEQTHYSDDEIDISTEIDIGENPQACPNIGDWFTDDATIDASGDLLTKFDDNISYY